MSNPYYQPEEFGLTILAEIEYSDHDSCFDTRIVWKDASGKLFTACDSGCSCPEPFEDYRILESLDTFDFNSLQSEVDDELKNTDSHITPIQARDFLAAVEAAMSPSKP